MPGLATGGGRQSLRALHPNLARFAQCRLQALKQTSARASPLAAVAGIKGAACRLSTSGGVRNTASTRWRCAASMPSSRRTTSATRWAGCMAESCC
jgi:hypothetical protein